MDRIAHNLKLIDTTVPVVRRPFRELVAKAEELGFRPFVSSALRPCSARPEASQVHGCRSWHVLGRAIDLELWDPETGTSTERAPYAELAEWWTETRGGTWGGVWTDAYPEGLPWMPEAGPGDVVHYQLTGGLDSVPHAICDPTKPCQPQVAAYLEREYSRPDRWIAPTVLIAGTAGIALSLGHKRSVWRVAKGTAITVAAGLVAGVATGYFTKGGPI